MAFSTQGTCIHARIPSISDFPISYSQTPAEKHTCQLANGRKYTAVEISRDCFDDATETVIKFLKSTLATSEANRVIPLLKPIDSNGKPYVIDYTSAAKNEAFIAYIGDHKTKTTVEFCKANNIKTQFYMIDTTDGQTTFKKNL